MTNEPYTDFEKLMSDVVDDGESIPAGATAAEVTMPRRFGKGYGRKPQPQATFSSREDGASKPLFNAGDVPENFAHNYKSEKPEHRMVAFYKAQGMSGVEIAERTGYSPASIYNILRLPWVQEVIVDEIKRSGRDAVQEMLHSGAMDNVMFLESVRNNEKAQIRDRITAAKELLDRTYGKASQPIIHSEVRDLNSLTDQELANIASKGSGAI